MLSRALVTVTVLLATIELRFLPTFTDTGHIQKGVERSKMNPLFCSLAEESFVKKCSLIAS
jgi:hypothetical protein